MNFYLLFFSVQKGNQPAVTHVQFQNYLVELSSWGFAEAWGTWGMAGECPFLLDVQFLRKKLYRPLPVSCALEQGAGVPEDAPAVPEAVLSFSHFSIEPECVTSFCCSSQSDCISLFSWTHLVKETRLSFKLVLLLTRKIKPSLLSGP